LHNRKKRLAFSALSLAALFGPTDSAADGFLQLARVGACWGAFIQTHGNIGPEILLNLNRSFRCQLEDLTIDVGAKYDTIIVDTPKIRKTEDLKATAIGENGPIPCHETMKPALVSNEFVPRTQR
jgi:hypothetical protein